MGEHPQPPRGTAPPNPPKPRHKPHSPGSFEDRQNLDHKAGGHRKRERAPGAQSKLQMKNSVFVFQPCLSSDRLLAISHKPPIPFPSQLPGAVAEMGKPTGQAGSVAILPQTGPL